MTEFKTMTDLETKTEFMTSTVLVPTTRVWVSTEIIDRTSTVEHTLTATSTQTQVATYVKTNTKTETDTEFKTSVSTETDFVTKTYLSTIVAPTTYFQTIVNTQVIDNVRLLPYCYCENCTDSAPPTTDKDGRGNTDQDDGRYGHLRLNCDCHRF